MITFMYTWVIVSLLVSLPLLWLLYIRVLVMCGKIESYDIKGYYADILIISITLLPIMNIATNLFFGYLLLRISGVIK
jgi:hypothetical protein